MKALTVCQPYADLILLPDSDPRHKRIENRQWFMDYRGPLLIHAGKSRKYLDLDETGTVDLEFDLPVADMVFGAVIGIVQVVGCFSTFNGRVPLWAFEHWPWTEKHPHIEGPQCIVLENCRRFAEPIPYLGLLKLWDFPDERLPGEARAA